MFAYSISQSAALARTNLIHHQQQNESDLVNLFGDDMVLGAVPRRTNNFCAAMQK